MPSRGFGCVLMCGCLLALPATAADAKPAADAAPAADGGKLAPGEYAGKLTTVPGTDGAFTVNVETDRYQPDPKAVQKETRESQQIAKLEAELGSARNAKEYNQRLQKLAAELQKVQAQGGKPGGKIIKEYKETHFQTADAVKVRTLTLPTRFDDKGNPKEYTKAELKELKGKDSDLPGYESTLDALKTNDAVKVTLLAPKPVKKDADAAKGDDKPKDADAKKGNEVTLIVILAEDNGATNKKK